MGELTLTEAELVACVPAASGAAEATTVADELGLAILRCVNTYTLTYQSIYVCMYMIQEI